MTRGVDLAGACLPDDDQHHPRRLGLRFVGRLAAYEVVAICAAAVVANVVDQALTRAATARGVVRRTLRTPRGAR